MDPPPHKVTPTFDGTRPGAPRPERRAMHSGPRPLGCGGAMQLRLVPPTAANTCMIGTSAAAAPLAGATDGPVDDATQQLAKTKLSAGAGGPV